MRKGIVGFIMGLLVAASLAGVTVKAQETVEQEQSAEMQREEFKIVKGVLKKYLGDAKEVVIPDGVTRIAAKAFGRNNTITSVIIPDSVLYIEEYAFGYCKNLISVQMENSVEDIESAAFEGCIRLKEVTLSNRLKVLRFCVFNNCKSIEELVIPEGVKIVEGLELINLKRLTLPSTLIHIEYIGPEWETIYITGGGNEYLMEMLNTYDIHRKKYWVQEQSVEGEESSDIIVMKPEESDTQTDISEDSAEFVIRDGVLIKYQGTATEVIVPEGVKEIGERAFYFDNFTIQKVVLPEGLERIRKDGFGYCNELREVVLPESVERIGAFAFEHCSKLETINLSHVKRLDYGAFYCCEGLKSVDLSSLERLEDSVFAGSNVAEITGLTKLPELDGNGFSGNPYWNQYKERIGSDLWIMDGVLLSGREASGAVQIPDTVTKIADNAFMGNTKITSVTIPDSVTEIGEGAFWGCKKLKTVRMEDSVETLGEKAFFRCKRLTDIRLSNRIQILPSMCFSECYSLKKITLPEQVIAVDSFCFWKNDKLTDITVPGSILMWEYSEVPKVNYYVVDSNLNYFLEHIATGRKWNLSNVALATDTVTLSVGEKYPLRFVGGTKATWKSSNKSVVTVGRTGNIYAKKPGKTTITATVYGKEYTCEVTVK